MRHGDVPPGVAEEKPQFVEVLRRQPLGYDVVIKRLPELEQRIAMLKTWETRIRGLRRDLEGFVGPYVCYRELLWRLEL